MADPVATSDEKHNCGDYGCKDGCIVECTAGGFGKWGHREPSRSGTETLGEACVERNGWQGFGLG